MGFLSAATASVAVLASLMPHGVTADKPYHTDLQSYQKGDLGDKPHQGFKSSDIVAAVFQVNYFNPDKVDTDSPYIFMAGSYGRGWGPSIWRSDDLSLVWADNVYNGLAQTARTWDNFKGQRVMSSYSDGRVRVYDQNYKQLYVFDGKGDLDGVVPDSHEAMLTADDTILMFLCPARDADLSKVGGPAEGKKIADCTIQEIEPDSGEVLFEWATSEHFNPEDSYVGYHDDDVWDFCHMNAVEKTEEGNYLISYRHLSCVILLDGKTKEVIWIMWGKKNMFKDITQNGTAEFNFQHEARITGENRFTLFDNHRDNHNGFCDDQTEETCSRGLEVEYNPETMEVWVANEWRHPQSLVSASRGGVQRTPKGNVMVAWGQNPMYTEYTADGELVMDIQRGQVLPIEHGIFDVITYRVWKGDWKGNPDWKPAIACAPDDTGRSIYVSWNGATEVHDWVLLMSDNQTDLNGADNVYAQSPRNGFETRFQVDNLLDFARIAALDVNGTIIGFTHAIDTSTYKQVLLDYDITEVTTTGTTINAAIPSSAKVSVPTGSCTGHACPDDNNEESSVGGYSLPSKTVMGSVAGGFVVCAGAIIGLVLCLRFRKSRKSAQEPSESKAEASYGLLMADRFNDQPDDEDARISKELEKERTHEVESVSSHSRDDSR